MQLYSWAYFADMSFFMSSLLTLWWICLYTWSTSPRRPTTFSPKCLVRNNGGEMKDKNIETKNTT